MRSGGSAHPLARRLARLQRRIPVDRSAMWRPYLAACFAGSEYDAVRADLIAALCSESPAYNFGLASDPAQDGQPCTYLVSWWDRDHGGRPQVKGYPAAWVAANTPQVRQVIGVPYDAI